MKFLCSSFHGPRMEIDADTPADARAAYLVAHPPLEGYEPDVTVAQDCEIS